MREEYILVLNEWTRRGHNTFLESGQLSWVSTAPAPAWLQPGLQEDEQKSFVNKPSTINRSIRANWQMNGHIFMANATEPSVWMDWLVVSAGRSVGL